jgi:hypothetical protein
MATAGAPSCGGLSYPSPSHDHLRPPRIHLSLCCSHPSTTTTTTTAPIQHVHPPTHLPTYLHPHTLPSLQRRPHCPHARHRVGPGAQGKKLAWRPNAHHLGGRENRHLSHQPAQPYVNVRHGGGDTTHVMVTVAAYVMICYDVDTVEAFIVDRSPHTPI